MSSWEREKCPMPYTLSHDAQVSSSNSTTSCRQVLHLSLILTSFKVSRSQTNVRIGWFSGVAWVNILKGHWINRMRINKANDRGYGRLSGRLLFSLNPLPYSLFKSLMGGGGHMPYVTDLTFSITREIVRTFRNNEGGLGIRFEKQHWNF